MYNRRYFLEKLMGASVATSLWQIFGMGQSPIAINALDLSSNSENVNIFNIEPRLGYDFLSPIAQGIGGGIGEFSYSMGEAGGNIIRGAGQGIGERLRDFVANTEGKRKLYEYSQQQDFERKRELIELMRDSLREFQAQQIDLTLTEIQSTWDLYNWNGIINPQETKDLLKEQKDCLLILLSPTEISEDAPSSIRNNLKIDLESMEAFLVKYYPNGDKQHLVKFYSDYFKRPIGNINIEQLHKILAPFPTVILNTDVTDYYCTVNVHFWGVENDKPQLYSSKRWKYQQTRKELISKGVQEEESLQIIRQTIVNSNKLFAAYIADLYYLNLDPYYQLCLPKMTDEFKQEGLDQKVLNTYLNQLKNIQKIEQQVYDRELKEVAKEIKEQKPVNEDDEETIRANAQKWKLVRTIKGNIMVYNIAISPDGERIATVGLSNSIELRNLKTGILIATLSKDSSYVNSVVFSPDGQTLASVSADNTIKLWNNLKAYTLTGLFLSLAISPDGEILASGSADNTIKLWNLRTRKLIYTLTGHSNLVNSVAFSPDGQTLASGSEDKTIKLWNFKRGKLIRTLQDHSDSITSVVISPNGQTLASVSLHGTIKLWDMKTGQLIRTLIEGYIDTFQYRSVAFTPDGQTLATGESSDNTIKLWNPKTGEMLRILKVPGFLTIVDFVAFSSDGHTLVSGGNSDTIRIWQDI